MLELSRELKFYSSLTNRNITEKECEPVLNVWNKFEIKAMKSYHDLYLKRDALVLADLFEKLINNSLKEL